MDGKMFNFQVNKIQGERKGSRRMNQSEQSKKLQNQVSKVQKEYYQNKAGDQERRMNNFSFKTIQAPLVEDKPGENSQNFQYFGSQVLNISIAQNSTYYQNLLIIIGQNSPSSQFSTSTPTSYFSSPPSEINKPTPTLQYFPSKIKAILNFPNLHYFLILFPQPYHGFCAKRYIHYYMTSYLAYVGLTFFGLCVDIQNIGLSDAGDGLMLAAFLVMLLHCTELLMFKFYSIDNYNFGMQKQSMGMSQILSSSGSSFFSSGSCSFQKPMFSHEQIYDSFLLFIQSASNQMAEDVHDINIEYHNLRQSIQQITNNKSADSYVLGILDKIYQIISSILILEAPGEGIKLNKCDSTLTNQTSSTLGKQSLLYNISRIVYKLFTGSTKQKYAHIILNLEASSQRVFMELIEREMYRINKDKDLSEQTSCIGSSNQRFIDCPELMMPVQGFPSEMEQNIKVEGIKKSASCTTLPFNELVIKVLNLEEQNGILASKLQQFQQKSALLQRENEHLKSLNRSLHENVKSLNIKIGELLTQLDNLAAENLSQIRKLDKKWQSRIKLYQKNKEQQIVELKQINEATQKKADIKIMEFEQRLTIKREKITKLYENQQRLENKLREQQEIMKADKEQIKYLNSIISKNREDLNELEVIRDQLTMDIEVRDNRLEDMRLLLFSEKSRIPMGKEQSSIVGQNQNCCVVDQFQWSVGTNQWKDSTHASKFQKLNLNTHYVNQVGMGTGLSWFKQSFSKNKKLSGPHEDYNHHYEAHINYLHRKIDFLVNQNESYMKSQKLVRDLKTENNKLIKSLKQHQYYRGQQNQIMTGCLYELRKIYESNFMEIGSRQTSNMNFKRNSKQLYQDQNIENGSKSELSPMNHV